MLRPPPWRRTSSLEHGKRAPAWLATLSLLTLGRAAYADEPPTFEDLSQLSMQELMDVTVTPFEVSTRHDRRYRASNSVSGSRIDTPIAELPFAVQAFTAGFIDDQRPENVFDVARYSPGVTYRSNDFNEGNANVAIRGFAVGNKPGDTQVLRDGLRGPSIFDFTNIDRVEVMKGPASFLYGQLAPGGVVNVITKSPQPELAATGRVAYGSYDEYRLEADVTGPVTKHLLYRLAASYRHDLNYWQPYDARSMDLAPSLSWQANERIKLTAKLESFRKRESPPLYQKPTYASWVGVVPTASDPNLQNVEPAGLPDDWNSMAYSDFRDSDTNSVTLSLDAKLDPAWAMRVRYGYQHYRVDAAFTGNFGMANGSFMQGRRYRRQIYANTDHTFEAEATGKYRVDGGALGGLTLRALVGAQLIASVFRRTAGQAPNDPALGTTPASPLPPWDLRDPSTWDRTNDLPLSSLTTSGFDERRLGMDRAAYGGLTFGAFDERLLALAGVRYTSSEQRFTSGTTLTVPDYVADKLTPQLGLLVKPAGGVSLFASYAESFVPNPDPLYVLGVESGLAAPTQGRGVDAGVKLDLLAGRVSATATVFQITNTHIRNDVAVLDPGTGVQLFTTVQSGEQRSRGVELDATLSLTDDWQALLSYSYTDARIVEFSGRDDAILAQDPLTLDAAGQANYKNVLRFHGAPLQMSAPHLASLWTRYTVSSGVLAGLYGAAGVSYVHDQTLAPDSPASVHQSYALYDALLGYRWALGVYPVSVDVRGKNLANARYRPSQSTRARPREVVGALTVQL